MVRSQIHRPGAAQPLNGVHYYRFCGHRQILVSREIDRGGQVDRVRIRIAIDRDSRVVTSVDTGERDDVVARACIDRQATCGIDEVDRFAEGRIDHVLAIRGRTICDRDHIGTTAEGEDAVSC